MAVTSMRGVTVDMARLAAQNQNKIALSGHPKGRDNKTLQPSLNARGDLVGEGGKVVVAREQLSRDYHRANPKAVKQVALRDIKTEVYAADTPAQAVAKQREAQRKQRKIVDSN